jgi:autotransporter-associated beta strand protein
LDPRFTTAGGLVTVNDVYTVGSVSFRAIADAASSGTTGFTGTGKLIFDNGANPATLSMGRTTVRMPLLREDINLDLELKSDLEIRFGNGRSGTTLGRIGKVVSGTGKLTLTLGSWWDGVNAGGTNNRFKIGNGGVNNPNTYSGGTEIRSSNATTYGTGGGGSTVALIVDAMSTAAFGTGDVVLSSAGLSGTAGNTAVSTLSDTSGGLQLILSAANVFGSTAKLTQSGSGAGLVLLEATQQTIAGLETLGTTTEQGRKRISSLAGAALTLNTQAGQSYSYGGIIVGPTTLTVGGSGTQVLANVNTYTGATTVSSGTLKIGVNNAIAGDSALTVGSGATQGTLDLTGFTQTTASLTFGGTGGTVAGSNGTLAMQGLAGADATITVGAAADATIAATLSLATPTDVDVATGRTLQLGALIGANGLTKTGAGALTLAGAGHSGGFDIQAGRLNVNVGNAFGAADGGLSLGTGVTLDNTSGGAVAVGTAEPITLGNSLSFLGTNALNLGAGQVTLGATSTVDVAASTLTFGGNVTGTGFGIVKTGLGTLVLAGASTYTGATTVAAGTLVLNGNLANASLGVNTGARLMGSGSIAGQTTIAGTHAPGNSPGIQPFADLAYDGGTSVVEWDLIGNTSSGAGSNFDQIVVGGNLSFTAATSLNLVFNGTGSTVDWTNAFWTEPRSWLLYDVAGTTAGVGNFTVNVAPSTWLDGQGNTFSASPVSSSTFAVTQVGEDVFLSYIPVPEPATWLLTVAGGLLVAASVVNRRRTACPG